jgi:hypothetical protein
MYTFPVSGRVSIVTTGIFLDCRDSSVGPIAAVSCGAMTMPFTPWLISVCVLEISLETSLLEFVVLRSTPSLPANCGT